MASEYWSNDSRSTLAAGITAGATTLTIVTPGAGRDFPASVPFRVVCGTEIMLVTARSGTTFTVTRGIEGTTAASHAAGAVVSHGVTAGALAWLRDIDARDIPASGWHVKATLAALLDDLYSQYYTLATTTTYQVTSDGSDVTSDGVPVFTRM